MEVVATEKQDNVKISMKGLKKKSPLNIANDKRMEKYGSMESIQLRKKKKDELEFDFGFDKPEEDQKCENKKCAKELAKKRKLLNDAREVHETDTEVIRRLMKDVEYWKTKSFSYEKIATDVVSSMHSLKTALHSSSVKAALLTKQNPHMNEAFKQGIIDTVVEMKMLQQKLDDAELKQDMLQKKKP